MTKDFSTPSPFDLDRPVDRLSWRTRLGTPKERRYVRVAGVAPAVEVVPFTNSLECLRRAVTERVFQVEVGKSGKFTSPPRPRSGVFASRLANVRKQLLPLLPSTAPKSHEQFVLSYEGRKKVRYQRALDEIRAGRTNLEEDAKLKVFVKFEKTDRTNKSDPVPRVISPRDPRFNIRIGRYLKFLEKPLFKSIDQLFGHPTILKGYNAVESAKILREKWDNLRNPVAIGLDASRFDQHVSVDALKWEHGIYLSCYKQSKHKKRLSNLLMHQLHNKCYGDTPDGELKYSIMGTRMSGDMNTSMGNCLLMCAMIKAYLEFVGVTGSLANNGDDCVLFVEKQDLEAVMKPLSKWFLEMGFNMAIEQPVEEFEELEFCQTKPIFDGYGWIMCRNPHSAIVKDSVMLKNWDSSQLFRGWLDAVGTGGLALTGGLPVFQELYRLYVRSGKKRKIPIELIPWSFRSWKEGVNREYGKVHPEARASFYWAFGITPDEQLVMEKEYASMVISPVLGKYFNRVSFGDGF
jgi:hypothetical protein